MCIAHFLVCFQSCKFFYKFFYQYWPPLTSLILSQSAELLARTHLFFFTKNKECTSGSCDILVEMHQIFILHVQGSLSQLTTYFYCLFCSVKFISYHIICYLMKFVYQEWHINIYIETKGFNLKRSTINIGLIWLLIFKHKDHSLPLALKFITTVIVILY